MTRKINTASIAKIRYVAFPRITPSAIKTARTNSITKIIASNMLEDLQLLLYHILPGLFYLKL